MTTDDEMRARAAQAGLTKLRDADLRHFAAGIENNRQLLGRIPADLHWSEFAALQFRMSRQSKRHA